MYKRYNWENLYVTALSQTMLWISTSGDPLEEFSFDVSQAPVNDRNFIFVDFNNVEKRDLIYSHRREGSKLFYYRHFRDMMGNGAAELQHNDGTKVQINSVAQYFNFILNNTDDFGYVENYGTNKVKVWWWPSFVKWERKDIDDVLLELPNGTNNIVFDHAFEEFSHTQDTPAGTHTLLCEVVVTGWNTVEINDKRGKFLELLIDEDVFEFGSDWTLKFIWPTPEISDATFDSKWRVRLGKIEDQQDQTEWPVVVSTELLIKEPSTPQTDDHGKVPILDENGLLKWEFIDVDPVFVWTGVLTDVDDDDVYVCTPSKPLSAYHTGMQIIFMPDTSNPDGEIFIDVSGLGKKKVLSKWGLRIFEGAILQNTPYLLIYNWEVFLCESIESPNLFGVWFDGDVVISGNTTLARDMHYNNLTINSWFDLNPNGYKIFVKWKLENNGTILRNWNDWGNAWHSSGTSWIGAAGTGWVWMPSGTLWASGGWWNWASWVLASAWVSGSPGKPISPSYTEVDGVAWWQWWQWWPPWWSGWSWWNSERWIFYNKFLSIGEIFGFFYQPWSFLNNLNNFPLYWWSGWSWWGGSWSSGGWSSPSWSWGWGWGSGGVIYIAANVFENNWTISAIWWSGWNWGNSPSANWWWGWGWGNGGVLFLIYHEKLEEWTISLDWWSGWTWGTWWAGAGTNWQDWQEWTFIEMHF